MNLSIIIPTTGRGTLYGLVNSLLTQMEFLDEVIVVCDGMAAYDEVNEIGLPDRDDKLRIVYTKLTHNGGNHQRNAGMMLAQGSHLAFLDDDDAISTNYIKRIKDGIMDENAIHLFRMKHSLPEIGIIWKEKEIKHCNVSTQMVIVPNDRYKLVFWVEGVYESDLYFISSCAKHFKDVVWHEEIIAYHNGGAK